MENYYNELLYKMETDIDELEIEADCPIQRIETVIRIIVECLSELKKHILKRGFKNTEEEIHFFKHQKPVIVSKLIYYNAIYKIERKNQMKQSRLRSISIPN